MGCPALVGAAIPRKGPLRAAFQVRSDAKDGSDIGRGIADARALASAVVNSLQAET